ncbi:MAG: DUF4268 domain-containing protein [Candidatus Methanofastidiosa archaeon]|nr:DUF4268 domain-containing protein [Candidatus Methanofastidiosa archaeon]
MKNFGKLEKVELRELWNGEATDFTPWLSKEDNIADLGEAIGMELEVQEQEQRVGVFRADILCKDVVTDHFVLIENQLERTDHTHLGQLMTYAAGLEAVTIIWIAKSFAEEHRAALDWLNNITDETINFFGIEIEAFKIGDSLPAPSFNIVAKPNDWTRSVKISASSVKMTDTKQFQLEYWEAMKIYFEESKTFLKFPKPYPQHWTNFSLGKSNYWMSAICSVRNNFIRIDVNIAGENAKEKFNLLKSKYELDSKSKLGDEILWDELPEAKQSIIQFRKDIDVRDKKQWNDQHEWLRSNLEKFDKYFRPKIKEL